MLQQIQLDAGRAFAEIGMTMVAENGPTPLAELRDFLAQGHVRVAVDETDAPIAFLVGALVDGCAHVEQVSVSPHHAGNGIGSDLIEYFADWARARGLPALTLTTFVEVPWNGPYYARLGFHRISDAGLAPGLRAIRAEEIALGLDAWPRSAMRRELD